jgi:dUTP pyrophosphatase
MDGYEIPKIPTFQFALTGDLPDLYLPTKGTPNATGWDVRSAEDLIIYEAEYAKIRLGFRMFSPPGWWMEIRPRSSSFAKKSLHALYGVIDEDYEGEMVFACQFLPKNINARFGMYEKIEIKAGEAIGQIIPVRRQEMKVERISNEEYEALCKERNHSRGSGGFGSTG